MNKLTILVVEDDMSVKNLITTTLKAHDYRFLTAKNGETAIMEASSHNPDVVLLDLGLPDMDGIEVIKKIRSWSNIPIIVISARSEDTDKIDALDAGADDYLTKPFSVEEFMNTYRQCEELVRKGLIRHIGISNMTIPKMEAVLPLMEIMPSACESEMHVCFQQKEIFDYLTEHKIQPIGFMPLGSPQRPERDKCPEDVADLQTPEMQEIAKAHGCHPALIALKWAHQRGQIPIPFSVHEAEYVSNLKAMIEDPLTEEEMQKIATLERNNRLVKGQVFLWEGAKDWHDLWDEEGKIVTL